MEKINKEELMKKLNLTEEELEKVAGGGIGIPDCNEVKAGIINDINYCYSHLYECVFCDNSH